MGNRIGLAAALFASLLLAGCGPAQTGRDPLVPPSAVAVREAASAPDGDHSRVEQAVRERARLVLQAFRDGDHGRLADLVHPEKGVRFSLAGFVRTGEDGDPVFLPEQLRKAATDETVYRWGFTDGKGDPITMNLAQHLASYRTSRDYLNAPVVSYNKVVQQGNTRVNIAEAYPDGVFLEFHFPGTEANGGYDWSSLRLVFEAAGGTWYLVGVSHDHWTI